MHVWVNDERCELAAGARVAEALAALDMPTRGVAVAVDGTVVPRAAWAEVELADGARMDVVTAVQGG